MDEEGVLVDAFAVQAVQAVQLTQSTSDWSQLRAAAAGGHLRMEPGVAEKAAKRCEAMVATLNEHWFGARLLKVGGAAGASLAAPSTSKPPVGPTR